MRETIVFLMMGVEPRCRAAGEEQKAHVWERRYWSLFCGKTAVIVGVGVIGIATAKLLKAFEMQVVGVTRTPRAVEGFDEIIPTDATAGKPRPAPISDQRSAGDERQCCCCSMPRYSRR